MPARDDYGHDQYSPERERNTIVVEDELLREGFTQVPNSLLKRPDVTHGAKIAYALLLSYAWQHDRCFPGQDALAADMGVERKAVIRYLKELKDKGIITVKRRGMGKTNVYHLPRFADVPKMGHQEVPPADAPKMGHQEVPSKGLPDVPSWGHKEYSLKNTQNEEYLSNFERQRQNEETNDGSLGEGTREPKTLQNQRHDVLLGRLVELRQRAAAGSEAGTVTAAEQQAPGSGTTQRPPRPQRPVASPSSTTEEREILRAYLADFCRELGDEAPLAASVTRALNIFATAGLPPACWGEALYRARAVTQEHTGQITKRAAGGSSIRQKNKVPYFFSVLEQLVGLRPAPADPTPPPS